MTWKTWLIGLANGVISALASGVTADLLGVGWHKVLEIAAASIVVSVAKWVLQHPLPGTPTETK